MYLLTQRDINEADLICGGRGRGGIYLHTSENEQI